MVDGAENGPVGGFDRTGCAAGLGRAALILKQIAAVPLDQLQALKKAMYADWGNGLLSDDEAVDIEARISKRANSKFPERKHRAAPDREAARHRRRRLGGSGVMPDMLRHHYTEGERSVLCIVAGEVKARGVCELCIDQIAALAGVSRTTVQNAMRMAKKLGHVSVTERRMKGRKNGTNVVRIASAEWLAWIKRGPTAHRAIGFKAFDCLRPTKSQKKEERGFRDRRAAPAQAEHVPKPRRAIASAATT